MFLNNYYNDEKGSMAVITALCLFTILLGVAVALDFSAMTQKKQLLQDTADAAVLTAAVSGSTNSEELKQIAQDSAAGHIKSSIEYELDLTLSGSDILVTIDTDHEMMLMNIFGHDTKPVSVEAGSAIGLGQKINIALALDTTGSMAGSRFNAMTDATEDLIDIVDGADANRGLAKISLVPFSDYVRIDTGFRNANWLDVPPDRVSTGQYLDEANSVNCRPVGSGETATTECDSYAYITTTDTISWVGCMGSRPNGDNETLGFNNSRYKGLAGGGCDERYNIITPLTDDFSQLKSNINDYTMVGRTYIPAGLNWAWRTLEEADSFTNERLDDDETQKIIILMSDGSNTVSTNGTVDGWDGLFHWLMNEDDDREKADELTRNFCQSIKADGIRLITVAYEVTDSDTRELMQNCASAGSDYYDATNASQLVTAFKKIGNGLKTVRLTR